MLLEMDQRRGVPAMMLRSVAILALSLAAQPTRSPSAQLRRQFTNQPRYGYIVLGPRSSAAFHLRAGDTLPEIHADQLPSRVSEAAIKAAVGHRFNPACSRYFDAGTAYVLLFRSSCRSGEVIEDGEGLSALTRGGESIAGTFPSLTNDDYTDLNPSERFH